MVQFLLRHGPERVFFFFFLAKLLVRQPPDLPDLLRRHCFLVNGCAFSCKEAFHPAPASSLAGIGYFALPVVGRHIFSGRADSGVPANAQQQSVTCFCTSPVRLAQLLAETKNCCNRRRHIYNNHNDKSWLEEFQTERF